jgi:cyclopropane fatty-acyl-phospholipid synthase-like methyltransferase
MGFFDSEKNVAAYLKMAEGYDGKELIKKLKSYLPKGKTVLEIGMGPGKDLDILKRDYRVTGSDSSQVFLDRYKSKNKREKLLKLDAVTLDTKRTFDCIYSNKVLHHLTKKNLKTSLKRQCELLKKNGIILHSFWQGNKQEKYNDLLFTYYSVGQIAGMVEDFFDILEIVVYKEMKKDDSLYVIGRKR